MGGLAGWQGRLANGWVDGEGNWWVSIPSAGGLLTVGGHAPAHAFCTSLLLTPLSLRHLLRQVAFMPPGPCEEAAWQEVHVPDRIACCRSLLLPSHATHHRRIAFMEGEKAAWQDLEEVYAPAADEGRLPLRVYAFVALPTWQVPACCSAGLLACWLWLVWWG